FSSRVMRARRAVIFASVEAWAARAGLRPASRATVINGTRTVSPGAITKGCNRTRRGRRAQAWVSDPIEEGSMLSLPHTETRKHPIQHIIGRHHTDQIVQGSDGRSEVRRRGSRIDAFLLRRLERIQLDAGT